MNPDAPSSDALQRDLQLQRLILDGWKAEDELFKQHYEPLQRSFFASRDFRSVSEHIVEEAVASSLAKLFERSASGSLRAWKSVDKEGNKAPLFTYLYKSAKNELLRLIKEEKAKGTQEGDMEHIETHATSSTHTDTTAELIHEQLANHLPHLELTIQEQSKAKPRVLVLEQLAALGVMDVCAAKIFAWDKTYANQEMRKLEKQRIHTVWKPKSGDDERKALAQLRLVLARHPELLAGRGLGTPSPKNDLTDAEHRELVSIAKTAVEDQVEAVLARELWRKKQSLIELFEHFAELAKKDSVSLDGIHVGKVPDDRQISANRTAERLQKAIGRDRFQAELSRILKLLLQHHQPHAEALDEDQVNILTSHYLNLMAATRWQDRLWKHDAALDCLASAMSKTRTDTKKGKPPPLRQNDHLRGKADQLQRELSRVADMLLPMDFTHFIDESCRTMHHAMLTATQATGATLWLMNTKLRKLQAVFNPAEEGKGGIVGQLQALDAGIVSWVHQKRRGVYFTRKEGVTGHPGNHKPYAHSSEIDHKLGKTTASMIVLPFECCGAGRGVLSLVRTGANMSPFTTSECQILVGFRDMLVCSIEQSLTSQIMG
jgi:hypothetical protein